MGLFKALGRAHLVSVFLYSLDESFPVSSDVFQAVTCGYSVSGCWRARSLLRWWDRAVFP